MKTSERLKMIADLLNACLTLNYEGNGSSQLHEMLNKAFAQALCEKVAWEREEVEKN